MAQGWLKKTGIICHMAKSEFWVAEAADFYQTYDYIFATPILSTISSEKFAVY